MNQLEKLFIPQENGDIIVNKIELGRHPLLKPLIAKVKSKEQVDKLMFVYLMSDIGSMYNHLSGDELFQAVKNHFGYDDIWKPSPDMMVAIEAYSDLTSLSATGRTYKTTLKAVYETGKDLERQQDMIILLKGQLETRINNVKNNSSFTESEKMENIKEARAYLSELASAQKDLIKNIREIPTLIDLTKSLAIKFAEENSTAQEVHGGGTIGNRE